ncbi:HAD family hydrolase [Pseudomonas aeruginosa]
MKIKAIICDMDGVLVDARDWHYETLNKALALFGYKIERHEHLTTFDGLPTSTKLKMLSADRGLPESLHSFINEMKQTYTADTVILSCRPIFHIQYALRMLKARGFKLAVASNSVRGSVSLMMEKSHLSQYLDLQLSNEDVASPKPAPDIYIKAMQMLGVSPEETLIIEDNAHGIAAAKASGAHVLEVSDPSGVNLDNIMNRISEIEGKGLAQVVNA